jgi:hypothetical protein
MEHVELAEGHVEYLYRETVIARIIKMCSQVSYCRFDWLRKSHAHSFHLHCLTRVNASTQCARFIQDNYVFTQDLHWYISILVDLTCVSRVTRENSKLLAEQFLDVVIRVPAVRPFAVKCLVRASVHQFLYPLESNIRLSH